MEGATASRSQLSRGTFHYKHTSPPSETNTTARRPFRRNLELPPKRYRKMTSVLVCQIKVSTILTGENEAGIFRRKTLLVVGRRAVFA